MLSITPTVSCPGTNANPPRKSPVYCSWSVPQRPHASTRRTASSSPCSGTGSSRATSVRGFSSTNARADRDDTTAELPASLRARFGVFQLEQEGLALRAPAVVADAAARGHDAVARDDD